MIERKKLSVGLFKKSEENKMEDYLQLPIEGLNIGLPTDYGTNFQKIVEFKLQEMKDNPEQFFNFGFTYNDFKAYLFKLAYCRAVRKYVERKRLEKIAEFQENNNFTFGLQLQEPVAN